MPNSLAGYYFCDLSFMMLTDSIRSDRLDFVPFLRNSFGREKVHEYTCMTMGKQLYHAGPSG